MGSYDLRLLPAFDDLFSMIVNRFRAMFVLVVLIHQIISIYTKWQRPLINPTEKRKKDNVNYSIPWIVFNN